MALVLLALLLSACSQGEGFDIPPMGFVLFAGLVVGYVLGRRGEARRLKLREAARQYREDTRDPKLDYRLGHVKEWRKTGKLVPLGRVGR